MSDTFTVSATDGAARAGTLRTAHGDVPTPAFMPVGTKATVKTVDPDELRAIGTPILLANTYHLHFRPGEDLIAELGGLHRFMGWEGPILTDSGGFQVFSLRDTIAAVDDDGVTFRSVYDGARRSFHARVSREDPGRARVRHRDVSRHLSARGRSSRRACRSRPAHDTLGRAPTRCTACGRPAPLRDRAGRVRLGAAPPFDCGDRRARLRRTRAGRSGDRRGTRGDVRDHGLGRRAAPR